MTENAIKHHQFASNVKSYVNVFFFVECIAKCYFRDGCCHFLLLAVPRRLFCFGSLVILDVARCYLWLFTLYINIKISKNSC